VFASPTEPWFEPAGVYITDSIRADFRRRPGSIDLGRGSG